jgi:hypothetical protein
MERGKLPPEKRGKPTGPKAANFPMEWIARGGKKAPGVPGGPGATALNGKNGRDNDAADGSITTATSEENPATDDTDSIGEVRTQFPVKLEFKLPRNVKFYNCATVHKEWFSLLKRKDPSARIITYKDAAITTESQFPKTQKEYDNAFPQRVTRQPGQPRAAEIVFEVETRESFQNLKTFNKDMMDFLTRKGVYMKMNSSSQLRRDSLGFFTHVHPKATWRLDLQKKITEALKTHMTWEEIEKAEKASDGNTEKDVFVTLNFRKQYIKAKEGLIQTETLELQTAPEIKESINSAIFKAVRNGQLPGKYFPYGVSQTLGSEEYRKVLMRQNAFLAATVVVGIQGLTEEALNSEISYRNGNGLEVQTKARDMLTQHQGIMALEKTNLTEERGKYVLVCDKNVDETQEFIDFSCTYLNDEITEQVRHKTHSEIRRASSTKWSTQIQQYAREIVIIEDDTPLPRKPPNAWQNKIIIVNDMENFPKLPSRPRANRNPTKEKVPQLAKESSSTQLVEDKLREMEEKMNQQMEDKIERLEKRCQDLEKSLEMTMKTIDRMVEAYERSEALNREITQRSEEVAKKNAEAQIVASRAQFAEMARDLLARMEDKMEWMETEMRESKKRALENTNQGLGKSQNTNQK